MLGRSRQKRSCPSCERSVGAEAKICACGHPTPNMTFEERAKHEVERWRAMRQQQLTA